MTTVEYGTPSPRYLEAGLKQFTVAEYHRLIFHGIVREGEPNELLDGNLICKMPCGPRHDSVLQVLNKRFVRMLATGWDFRSGCAVTLPPWDEAEPDCALVRGDENTYRRHHPGPADIGLLVEVSDNSLLVDRHDKARIYANASIPVYWVVNLVARQIEVFTQPSRPSPTASYGQRDIHAVGATVPVVLDGATIGSIAVADVMG